MPIIKFDDHPEFKPNVAPMDMFRKGIMGGTYFRPIKSAITGQKHSRMYLEWDWNKEDIPLYMVNSAECDPSINKYGVKSGSSLRDWERAGWIRAQDPYGWIQWYMRFYNGRRSPDDERQIKRWQAFAGEKGRFRRRLINMIQADAKKRRRNVKESLNDHSISPVIRQALLQWGYEVKLKDVR